MGGIIGMKKGIRMTNAQRCQKYYQGHREILIQKTRQWRLDNLERCHEYDVQRNKEFREQVFNHYGASCICCGETQLAFLTIDHINGDGAEHRRNGATSIYRWLVAHNFPEGFQTMCWNCNAAKHFQGECPHEQLKRAAQNDISEYYRQLAGWPSGG